MGSSKPFVMASFIGVTYFEGGKAGIFTS
jgi:hypothetical protein